MIIEEENPIENQKWSLKMTDHWMIIDWMIIDDENQKCNLKNFKVKKVW